MKTKVKNTRARKIQLSEAENQLSGAEFAAARAEVAEAAAAPEAQAAEGTQAATLPPIQVSNPVLGADLALLPSLPDPTLPVVDVSATAVLDQSTDGSTTNTALPTNTEATKDPIAELAEKGAKALEAAESGAIVIRRKLVTLTDEAYDWVNHPQSIPGPTLTREETEMLHRDPKAVVRTYCPKSFSPIQYIGRACLKKIRLVQGREITLEEIKFLVQPDGQIEQCWQRKWMFQPVKYVPFLSHQAEDDLRAGKKLEECRHAWGGSFTLRYGQILASSGPGYEPNGEFRSKESMLFIMAELMGQERRREECWPETREAVTKLLEKALNPQPQGLKLATILRQEAKATLEDLKKYKGPQDLNATLADLKLQIRRKPKNTALNGNGSH